MTKLNNKKIINNFRIEVKCCLEQNKVNDIIINKVKNIIHKYNIKEIKKLKGE